MPFSSRAAKKAKGETTLGPNWLDLPIEVTAKMLHKLGPFEIFTSVSLVCPLWWKVCMDPLMWRTIDLTNHPRDAHSKLVKFCLHAIERSCGHLEDISIKDIGTDVVLRNIANSGSHLRRMRLLKCSHISDVQLSAAVKKLPLLEEFEISFGYLSKDTLELMGKCCPHLKVLKFNIEEDKYLECDDEAFAIAKNMPQLRHLQLLGNRLTNEGLLAILDGCPHLESLDLRVCSNVNLSGSLREKCCKQIKNLRFPEDLNEISIYVAGGYVDDCEFECGCDIDRENEEAKEQAFRDSILAEYNDELRKGNIKFTP